MRFLLLFALLVFAPPLHAAEVPQLGYMYFARIPVLEDGRMKPMDSFARVMLARISGRTSLPSMSADEWLAETLFNPRAAIHERIFLVRSPSLLLRLGLPPSADGMYDFSTLAASVGEHQALFASLADKDKKELAPDDQNLATLYDSVNDFADLVGSFSLLMPLADIDAKTRSELGMPVNAEVTYLDLLKMRESIDTREKRTLAKKGNRVETYTPEELRIAKLSVRLTLLEELDRNDGLLRVIPPFWNESAEWLSPWAVVEKGAGSPESAALFKEWQALAHAYREHEAPEWQQASYALLQAGLAAKGVRPWAITLESAYNSLGLLNVSLLAYGLATALAAAALWQRSRRWHRWAYGVMLLGAALHAAAILMRMAILMRPPVSTLYESMVFVAFVVADAGLWLAQRKKSTDVILMSSACAAFLLAAARVFAGGGDTLEVLVPVLNTNFWLATHVVCITTGYGTSLLAGLLAHLYLLRRARGTMEKDLAPLGRRMHMAALVALLFTAVGTMLGGIWADQSWGRFWGWDPKENGALLIVLWLIWLLHGRVANQLSALGFAVGLALITVVVALAWVGVNLLSVGLHSYGFTDTAANGLMAFCAIEFCFVAGCTGIIWACNRKATV